FRTSRSSSCNAWADERLGPAEPRCRVRHAGHTDRLEKYTAVRVESYPLVTSARLISASSLRMLSATKLQRWRWSNGCIGACVFRVRSNGRADDRFAASLDEGPMGAAVLACGRFRVLRIRGGSLAGARRARVREGGGVATLRDQERERWRAAYLGRSGRRRRLAHSVE